MPTLEHMHERDKTKYYEITAYVPTTGLKMSFSADRTVEFSMDLVYEPTEVFFFMVDAAGNVYREAHITLPDCVLRYDTVAIAKANLSKNYAVTIWEFYPEFDD